MTETQNSINAERIAILGAGRGLGLELSRLVSERPGNQLLLVSKHAERARAICPKAEMLNLDFTLSEAVIATDQALRHFQPDRIWYIAGGGPFGYFQEKDWKDHIWAMKLNLLFPLELFHLNLRTSMRRPLQWIFVGSGIAESRAEVKGLAYGTSKVALRAAWESFQAEQAPQHGFSPRSLDVRFYSPGYIDTGLLPPHAAPRDPVAQQRIESVTTVATDFLSWSFDILHNNSHRTFGV